jgi:hypothetical protein
VPEKSAIELHDSDLKYLKLSGGSLEIALAPAYIHKSDGIPGSDRGTGWVQDALILVEDAESSVESFETPCELGGGTLKIGTDVYDNLIPLPLDRTAAVLLTLDSMWNDHHISIRGSSVKISLVGEPKYVEVFPG